MSFNRSTKTGVLNSIILHNVVPDAFADGTARYLSDRSEIWHRDFTFERGVFYRVESASGGGKSSLCSFIYGLRADYRGSIEIDGDNIRKLSPERIAAMRSFNIAYLPQDLSLFPELTVAENIEIKNSLTEFKTSAQIKEMCARLGIGNEMAGRRVSTLSIGQQQRVAIVRALCQPFDFILLDEPVSHLDEENNRAASQLISEEATAAGASIIATSVGNPLVIENSKIVKL